MAQIIKNRRGSIANLKSATANNAELIVASGSISDLSGPFVFIGSPALTDNGNQGAFRAVSKIYTGADAPTISNLTYGTTLDGTPFYASNNQSLYILANDGTGNTRLDLTGNIEDNIISNVTIDTLDGNVNITGDVTASNLQLSGDADITGNIVLGGNITLGDQDVDFVSFKADVSSSILPDVDNTFDLGSPTKQWANVYVQNIETSGSTIAGNVQITGTLDVDGQSTLASLNVEDLTSGRLIFAGTAGELEDSAALTFDGSTLTSTATISGSSNLNIDGQASIASLNVEDLTSGRVTFAGTDGELEDSSNLTFTGTVLSASNVSVATNLDVNTQAILASANIEDLTDNRIVLAGTDGELEDDANFTFDGTTFDIGQGNFTVDNSTGNTDVAGTFTVGGNTVLESDVFISGSMTLLGDATELIISSSTVELDDNIIRLNSFAPFQRYAGFEVIDSGSANVSASLVWDSQEDYWLIQSSSYETGKIISTTFGSLGSETSITPNTVAKATGDSSIGDSLITDTGTLFAYDTDALTIAATSGNTAVKGLVTLTSVGATDAGTNSSAIVYRNGSNQLGYVSTTETSNVLDGILGYNSQTGLLEFSTIIDGGTF